MIDFDRVEETVTEKFRGGEGVFKARMVVDERNRIMKAVLPPHSSIGMHCHETSSEIIYILSGVGTVVHEDVTEQLPAGSCHYCRKGESHSLSNRHEEDLVFFAVIPEQI